MSSMQVFDKQGTTEFGFTFTNFAGIGWKALFMQGLVLIQDLSNSTMFKVQYPKDKHWTYTKAELSFCEGSICKGGIISNEHFTLSVDVPEEPINSEFDPEFYETHDKGYLCLNIGTASTSIDIPSRFAHNLIKFMEGSTDLDNVIDVHKSK